MTKKPHSNSVNPCAKILAEIMRTCFLIGAETSFDAHFGWVAHVNLLTVRVLPKGATGSEHAVLEFDEYINITTATGLLVTPEFGTDTYPKVKAFSLTLTAFYEQRLAA